MVTAEKAPDTSVNLLMYRGSIEVLKNQILSAVLVRDVWGGDL